MKTTALITGASSGIGYELAKIFASRGHDLVLIARRYDTLNQLKIELEAKCKVSIHCIEKDLSKLNAAKEVYEEVKMKNIKIDFLINNAGFGDSCDFSQSNQERIIEMLELNIVALTQLSHLFLKDMINSGSGKIMNVASTAAFQPVPKMAVYAATKAYVLNFSEAINYEVKGKGITVTSLCPGATHSGFQKAASMEKSKLFERKFIPSSEKVAEFGYNAMMKGKSVAIHGFINRIMVFGVRFSPRNWVVVLASKIQG